MKTKKEKLVANLMADFEKLGGGSEIDSKFSIKDLETLTEKLQNSFDNFFSELINRPKSKITCCP